MFLFSSVINHTSNWFLAYKRDSGSQSPLCTTAARAIRDRKQYAEIDFFLLLLLFNSFGDRGGTVPISQNNNLSCSKWWKGITTKSKPGQRNKEGLFYAHKTPFSWCMSYCYLTVTCYLTDQSEWIEISSSYAFCIPILYR